jgi:hypothetical protein
MTADEVQARKAAGYRPYEPLAASRELRSALAQLASGFFSGGDANLARPLVDNLLVDDPFMVLADFDAYVAAQDRAEQAYRDTERWTRMSILNAARCGYFSSDRAIREYCDEIWKVSPIEVRAQGQDDEAVRRLGQPVADAPSQPQLSPDELEQLRDLPMLVGLDLMHATHSGAQGTLIALATAVASPTATARFVSRGALVPMLVGSEIEMIDRSEWLMEDLGKTYDLRSRAGRAALHDDVLARCRAAVDLLTSRAPRSDVAEYARWLLLVGQRVAEAAIEPQPGRPERQVSDAEAAALREIAASLRVES